MVYQYIFRVVCGGIVCALISQIAVKKLAGGKLIPLILGLFMTVTVISPLKDFDFTALVPEDISVSADASSLIAEGTFSTDSSIRAVIKQSLEEYILDKAKKLGAQLSVEVTLDENKLPASVTLSGNVSPYAKNALSQIITDDLGIAKEQQQWI